MRKRKTTRRKNSTKNAPPAPAGGEWIYGRHAVLAVLQNTARKTGRLIATAEAAARLRADRPAAAPEIVTRDALEAVLPDSAVHQGIAIQAEPLPAVALEDLIADAAGDAVAVVLDQVTDPHNVGAVLRSAAVFGAIAVVVQDRSAPPAAGALSKAASGALDLVPLVRAANLSRALDRFGRAGFWRVGFDGAADMSLSDAPLEGRVVLVLGAEGSGLRRLTREKCDYLVRIPAHGALDTLNVSNAAAVALYETTRRERPK